jgi:Zn-dependent protease
MQAGWRVGSLFGIPILIDPSWLGVFFLVAVPRSLDWHQRYPAWGLDVAFGAGIAMALLIFASVLLHELGHSLVAMAQGIRVTSITLFLFGGIAAIDQESKTPGKAFQVAIAGPLVSLLLAMALTAVNLLLADEPLPPNVILQNLALINFILALFNMIPGLPLDGGQVLKSLVWKLTGDRFKGIRWAARAGYLLGWTAVLSGITLFLLGQGGTWLGMQSGSWLWIALLGWFGVQNATQYNRMTDLQEALLSLSSSDAMTREFRVLDAELSLREFADQYLSVIGASPPVFFAASQGRYRGLVASDRLHKTERSEWEATAIQALVDPLDDIPSVRESTPLVAAIRLMEEQLLRRLTVLTPAGAVAGVMDRGDIVRALGSKLQVNVSNEIIQRIKDEGVYPPGLQLGAIAAAAAADLPEARTSES